MKFKSIYFLGALVLVAGGVSAVSLMVRRQQQARKREAEAEAARKAKLQAYHQQQRQHIARNVPRLPTDGSDVSVLYPTGATEGDHNNASSLHQHVYPGSDPQSHPSQTMAPYVVDGDTKVPLLHDATALSMMPTSESAAHYGFAVMTWDAGMQGEEIVYLGKGDMFERYPQSSSSSSNGGKGGYIKKGHTHTDKIVTPHLPFVGWDHHPYHATFSPTRSGAFKVLSVRDGAESLVKTLHYLNPRGERRSMTRVPSASRYEGPTVLRRRTDDNTLVSDVPLIFRVTRQLENTTLDTTTLHVLDWQHHVTTVQVTPDHKFRINNASEATLWMPFMSLDGAKMWARIREGQSHQFLVMDAASSQVTPEDMLSFLGPNEIFAHARLIMVKDVLEARKLNVI